MLIFYDTETQGLPMWGEPSEHPGQPHLVQLAALLTEDDGHAVAQMNVIIKPDGWTIPDEVAAIHGITTEKALRCGVDLPVAMGMFAQMLARADKRIAHNNSFDDKIAKIAGHRAHLLGIRAVIESQPAYCTMKAATNVCRILKAAPRSDTDWKWPKLAEAYKHFFGEDLAGAHDAMIDVKACRRIYFALNPRPAAA